jgi:hypothetical protein
MPPAPRRSPTTQQILPPSSFAALARLSPWLTSSLMLPRFHFASALERRDLRSTLSLVRRLRLAPRFLPWAFRTSHRACWIDLEPSF